MTRRLAWTAALLIAATALGALAARTPKKAEPAAPAKQLHGKQVFEKWCAPCHAPNPKLAGTLALQTKYKGELPAALEQRKDLTPEIVAAFVRNGVAWMAPFRKTEVSDGDLADLGAYLSTPETKRKETVR